MPRWCRGITAGVLSPELLLLADGSMKPSQNSLFKADTRVRSVAENGILGLVLGLPLSWIELAEERQDYCDNLNRYIDSGLVSRLHQPPIRKLQEGLRFNYLGVEHFFLFHEIPLYLDLVNTGALLSPCLAYLVIQYSDLSDKRKF